MGSAYCRLQKTKHSRRFASRGITGALAFLLSLSALLFAALPSAFAWTDPPLNISNNAGSSVYPDVAKEPGLNPDLHLVWEDNSDGVVKVWYAKWRQATGTWSAPQPITAGILPAIGADNAGRGHVVFRLGSDIWHTMQQQRDGGWPVLEKIGTTTETAVFPEVAAKPDGSIIHAMWEDGGSPGKDVQHRPHDTMSETWGPQVNVSSNAGRSERPHIVGDAAGNAHAVWADDSTGNLEIYYSKRTSGWSVPSIVRATPGTSNNPRVAVDSSGNPRVMWDEEMGVNNHDIFYSSWNGSSWSAPQNITADSADSTEPAIFLDGFNNLSAAFLDWYQDRGWSIRFISHRNGQWSTIVPVPKRSGIPGPPDLIVDGNGCVHIFWHEFVPPGNDDIHHTKNCDWAAPVTTLTTDPTSPDGTNSYYITDPHITLTTGTDTSTTYFQWDSTATSSYETYTAPIPAPEGQHTLYYYSVDLAGNTEQPVKSAAVKVDTTPPNAFTLASPADGSWTSNTSPTLGWNASSDSGSGLAKYQLYVDGVLSRDNILTTSLSATPGAALSAGQHSWYVVAVDRAGMTQASTPPPWQLGVDLTAPSAPTVTDDGVYTGSNTSLHATWSATDGESGIGEYFYAIGTATTTEAQRTNVVGWTSVGLATEVTRSGLTLVNGQIYYISVKAVNRAGLTSGIGASDGITVDRIGPNGFTLIGPSGWSTNRFPTFSWNPTTDAASGLKEYELRVGSLPAVIIPAGTTTYAWPTSLSDGSYSWFVRAYDKVGNITTSNTLAYGVDNTGPVMNLINDGIFTNNPTQLTATWSASDAGVGVIGGYLYAIGTTPGGTDVVWWTPIGTGGVTHIGLALASGQTYYFSVQAKDSLGNWGGVRSSDGVTVDTQPPEPFSLLSSDGICRSASQPLGWGTANDPVSGLDRYQIFINGSANITTTVTSGIPTGLSDGTYTWFVRAFDRAGNSRDSTQTTWTFKLDTQVPAFNLLTPANAVSATDWTTNANPNLTWQGNGDDTGCGLASYRVYLDSAPNRLLSSPFPVPPSTMASTFLSPLTDGQHTWRVDAADAVGNLRSTATWNYWVDNTAPPKPVVTVPGPYTNSTNQLSASWTGADPNEPPSLTRYRYSIGTSPGSTDVLGWSAYGSLQSVTQTLGLNEGWTYYFNVQSINAVNMESEIGSSIGIKVDRTGPSAPTLISPINGVWTGATTTFQWRASSDTGSGIAQYRVTITGPGGTQTQTAGGTSTSLTWPGLAGGSYTWTVTAIDGAGNSTPSATGSFGVDDGPPAAFSLKAPPDGTWAKGSIAFEWFPSSDAGIGLSKYQLYVDGALIRDNISAGSTSVAVSLGDGPHTWFVRAVDGAGNARQSAETWTINVDNTGPSNFDLQSPGNNSWTGNRPEFRWGQASDGGSGLQGYEVWIDDGILKLTVLGASTSATPGTALSEADHFWHVYAYDKMNPPNSRRSISRWVVRVDSVPPAPFTLNWPPNGAWTHSAPTFAWSISSDTRSGLAEYELWIDSQRSQDNISPTPTATCPSGTGTCRWSLPGENLLDGTHTWYVIARDVAGNSRQSNGVSPFFTINVDRTPPGPFDLVSPANNSWTTNTTPTFTWTPSSDAGSGLAKYQLYVDDVLNKDNIPMGSTSTTPAASLSDGLHTWYVKAVDNVGYSTKSTSTFTVGIDTGPPANVTGFTAVAGDGQIALSWVNPTTDFAGVRIYRKTDGYPTGPGDGTLVYDGTADHATDTGLTNGTTYYYKAFAYDGVGNLAACTTDGSICSGSATPEAPPPPPPSTTTTTTQPPAPGLCPSRDPKDPSRTGWDPPCNICIQWTPSSQAARYQVVNSDTGEVVKEVGAATTQASFPGRSDKKYHFHVVMFDANDKSWKTNQVELLTPKRTISHAVTGPFGGYVEIHCREAAVDVPVNSFVGTKNITIGNADPPAPAPSGQQLAGPVFDFGPDGSTFASDAPATVSLIYEPVPDPSKLIVAWYNTAAGKWMPITTGKKVSTANNTVSVQVTHFTSHAVFYGSLPPTGQDRLWILLAGLALILASGLTLVWTRLRTGK